MKFHPGAANRMVLVAPEWSQHGWIYGCSQRTQMKQSTKDQIEGTVRELKGKAKQTMGQITKNSNLAANGDNDNLAGKIQKKVGQIEKVFEK